MSWVPDVKWVTAIVGGIKVVVEIIKLRQNRNAPTRQSDSRDEEQPKIKKEKKKSKSGSKNHINKTSGYLERKRRNEAKKKKRAQKRSRRRNRPKRR